MSDRAEYTLVVGEHDTAGRRLAGTLSWSRGMSELRALAPPRAGRLDVALDNRDGAYNPHSTPLRRGQPVVLTAIAGATTYALFSGVLQRPEQRQVAFHETVALQALGTLTRLADKRGLSTALYADIRTDEALAVLLDAAGWPADARVLDEGLTTLAWWWLDGADAMTALRELLASEGPSAQVYEDAEGRIVFRNRHAVYLETRSTTAQADCGTGLPVLPGPTYDHGLQAVVNVCTLSVRQRAAQALDQVWALGSTLTLAAGESRTVEARPSGGDPVTGAETPTAGDGDFTVSAGSVASVVLGRTSGARIPITLTAGPAGAIVEGLRLRAQPVPVTFETVVSNSLDTSASQDEFGVQPFPLAARPEIDLDTAQDFCNAVVAYYQDGRARVAFATVNVDEAALLALLSRDIGDRIHVTLPRLGLDADVLLLRRDDLLQLGGVHRATFGCELADSEELGGPAIVGLTPVGSTTERAWF